MCSRGALIEGCVPSAFYELLQKAGVSEGGGGEESSDSISDSNGYYYHNCAHDNAKLAVITIKKPDIIQYYDWGLIPHRIRDRVSAEYARKQNKHARAETIYDKISYKEYIPFTRCIIAMSGFYDFHKAKSGKSYPYYVSARDDNNPEASKGFHVAGIYSHWTDPNTNETFKTVAVITTVANKTVEFVHNTQKRMASILEEADIKRWLDPKLSQKEIMDIISKPYPDSKMRAHLVDNFLVKKQNPNNPNTILRMKSENPDLPDLIEWD